MWQIKKPWPWHLLRIHRVDQVVDCGMLVHSSSMAVWSCWILARTGTRCRIRRSRASQTCSMGDMSGEYAGHARTGMFSASRNCVQILATLGHALSCCNMRWWSWTNGTTMGLRISKNGGKNKSVMFIILSLYKYIYTKLEYGEKVHFFL